MKCDVCGSILKDTSSLRRHNNKFHRSLYSPALVPKMPCCMCDQLCYTNEELESHLISKHDLVVEKERLSFSKEDDFNQWREAVESELKVKYVRCTSRKKDDSTVAYYACNRSGQPRIRVSGRVRRLKIAGSRKTGTQCLSRIKAKFFPSGSVEINFCKTHCGHGVDLRHIPISSTLKKEIASKLAAKIPMNEILDQVRFHSWDPDQELKRENLITSQDLRNILKSVSLENERVRNSDVEASVTDWLENKRNSDDTSCAPPAFEEASEEPEPVILDPPESFETKALVDCLPGDQKTSPENLADQKQQLLEAFKSLLDKAKTTKGIQALNQVIQNAVSIVEAADNITSTTTQVHFQNKKRATNKKIGPQRIFDTKKKKKIKMEQNE